MRAKTVRRPLVYMGCDPEFFFEKKGEIIGSEKFITEKEGILIDPYRTGVNAGPRAIGNGMIASKFIMDGVQVELNPRPDTCRARLSNEIAVCFQTLAEKMKADPDLKANFSPIVKVKKKELDSLSDKAKVFGCAPSKNVSNKEATITVNAAEYPYRSAGGHIHLGKYDNTSTTALAKPEILIDVLDIIVGNTCVLIDRDEGNIERRKVYGKAGEYRTPAYGIEYRTLSNFWLKANPLMSFVMSISRLSVGIAADAEMVAELKALVDMDLVRKAINENDFDLAYVNFKQIKQFLVELGNEENHFYGDEANYRVKPYYESYPFTRERMQALEYFIYKGVDHFFKEDPLTHWCNVKEGHYAGWESFCINTLIPKMNQKTFLKKVVEYATTPA